MLGINAMTLLGVNEYIRGDDDSVFGINDYVQGDLNCLIGINEYGYGDVGCSIGIDTFLKMYLSYRICIKKFGLPPLPLQRRRLSSFGIHSVCTSLFRSLK